MESDTPVMDKETTLLSRVAVNHLFLSQFEAFRAIILSLHHRNPNLAVSILQTIVANGGSFENVVYSSNCSSPALLTWLSSLELFQFDDGTSIWSIAPDDVRLRVEFLLYIQMVSSRVTESVERGGEEEELRDSMRMLDGIMEVGLRRLKEDLIVREKRDDDGKDASKTSVLLKEEELVGLRRVILENADVFDALSENIQRQVGGDLEPEDSSGLALTLRREERAGSVSSEEDQRLLKSIQKHVQIVHLDKMKQCLTNDDIDGLISHIRYLHLDYGVAEAEYRAVFQDFLKKVLSGKEDLGDIWRAARAKLLRIYQEALSSKCSHLVQLVQSVQDQLLEEEIEMLQASNEKILPPFQHLQDHIQKLKLSLDNDDHSLSLTSAITSCMRDLYHYARAAGLHVLEYVMDTALSAVRNEQLEEASYVISLFPRLQPLVGVMGWDLLAGKTAARRRLMNLLWTSKSQVSRFEESSLYMKESDERSSVEYLCDSLCYQLDLAAFAACVNSGQPWDVKSSLYFSGQGDVEFQVENSFLDPFVENFVLERLSSQSPVRVLFDVVPTIKFEDAIKLISMEPTNSTTAVWERIQDAELIHMRYALDCAVMALGAMEKSISDDKKNHAQMALYFLKQLRHHLEAINNVPRKIFMVNIIISLLHVDNIAVDSEQFGLAMSNSQLDHTSIDNYDDLDESGSQMVAAFVECLLDTLCHNLPSEYNLESTDTSGERQALEWRISSARSFIEDWQWRLSVLQQLLPLPELNWHWKEALTVLRAAPSKLLNLCMQKSKYDIGEEAVHRFSLSYEDKATLALAEWVDNAFKKASVEDAVNRASDGMATVQEIDFSFLRSQIGPVSAVLLCIDVATASARSMNISKWLMDQAEDMLSEIYPGVAPKIGATYWDQIREYALVSIAKRLLKHLREFLEQEHHSIQAVLSGETIFTSQQHGQRDRALALLHQMIEDAHMGKRQFLSGKLHNLARAVADEETGAEFSEVEEREQKYPSGFDQKSFLGLGLKAAKLASKNLADGESNVQLASYDVKDAEKRLFSPLSAKPSTYLSQFILHIAAIGDIVDGTDTTHDFNYFSLVYEWPKDLITRLVFKRGSTEAAEKVAEIMSSDFVHEVISACVPPVHPSHSGHGWASVPLVASGTKSSHFGNFQASSMRGTWPIQYSSAPTGIAQYPLQLEIIKHLVKISPVRAVLACVFGSSILYSGNESSNFGALNKELLHSPDADRLFYEFALDQSERFPTLNRWIQFQMNLNRVSEFVVTSKDAEDGGGVKYSRKCSIKRPREHDSDTESEVEDSVGSSLVAAPPDVNKAAAGRDTVQDYMQNLSVEDDASTVLTFDWENEEPYERAVERLIEEGKLMDALAISDRFLHNGASDKLLRLLIEREESCESSGSFQNRIPSNSWQYCLRLNDKQLAAELAMRCLHRWELDAALDVLTMCSCHLPEDKPIKNEILQRKQALQRYKHILSADGQYNSWQEVETAFREDPEGLALKLAEKGAVSAALEVAESAGLSIDLRRELQGRQLVKLLTADPLSGGGPAEASRFLSSLRDSDDALRVAMGAMQLLPNLRSKQLLVHFFLKRKDSNLSDAEVARLNSWALGLRVLSALPLPWQQRCSSLHEHPQLILEVLLMRKQLQSASMILREFPSLRDNDVIIKYGAKAIAISISSPSRETQITVSGPRHKQKTRTAAPTRSSFTGSLSNLQKAFSWAPRNTGEKAAPKESHRKRKSSILTAPEKATWEAMTGIQEDHGSHSGDGHDRLPSVSIAEEWMLTGDPKKDDAVRSLHRYDSAPDIILFKALLSLCSDESVSAKGAIDLCVNQMKSILSSKQLPGNASVEIIGRAYHATETFVEGLLYARSLLKKIVFSTDLAGSSERSRDADDASSDAGSSSIGSQNADELSELLSQADTWLQRAELLQSLLGSGIAASLDDIADQESSARLRDRLISEERYSMAVYTSRKCKIDVFPVWIAWGHALLRMEHYSQARVKFMQALQLCKNDSDFHVAPVILDIVNTIEGGPPADVSAVRSMYEHLAKSAPTILDDSLSADSYLNVLHMPSTCPRSERSRRSLESTASGSLAGADYDDGSRSNLDSIRYTECVNYLQDYARQHLAEFMFRHGHYTEACMLFFPENAVPPPPQPSSTGAVNSSTSPQRPDPLATDYGTIDSLCELCIGYGVMSELEEVISARTASSASASSAVNQYTEAALAKICNYCETHKHFNYLYKFLVIRKDHVAAGLCCIQLFMNSMSQEDAVKHLENAKMHFDEGLSARHRAGETNKLVGKGIRGKSASEKLTEEGLVKLSARAAIQVDVVRCLNESEGPQWKYSLFGNPNDPETFRRRCQIAETLAEKNFDLAFQVICQFNLPAVDIYAAVAASLAERKRGGQLTEFFKSIKGTIHDDDWDEVLGAAINVYANKHKERPDRLIDMLTNNHRKVLACVVCGRLKTAFQIASRSGVVADVQYVAHQALHANAHPVLDMCKQWLAQNM